MRIVFIVHTFFPNWRAGTEVYAKSLAKDLIQRGHEAWVVCYEPPQRQESFVGIQATERVYDGIPIHEISFCREYRDFHVTEYFNRDVEDHLLSYFTEIRPDIVHVIHAMHLSTASIWAAKKLNLPVVATATDFWYVCPTYQLLKWDQSLCQGPEPTACLACVTSAKASSWPRRLAARKYFARVVGPVLVLLSRLRVLHSQELANLVWLSERVSWMKKTVAQVDVLLAPCVNTERLFTANGLKALETRISGFGLESHASDADPARRDSAVLRIGYVGTFGHSKGLHILLAAIRQLPAERVRLEVYGRMGHFPEYDSCLSSLSEGLENVLFRGVFPNERLSEVFAGLDVLVIPSLWYENSPLVLLSAFAHKTPVMASNVGSLADLVEHGKNGLLFEMGNTAELAAQIRRLIDEPGLLARLRAGIPEVKTVAQNINELVEIYARLNCNSQAAPGRTVVRPHHLPRGALWWGSLIRSVKMLSLGAQFGTDLVLLRCEVRPLGEGKLSLGFQWHAREIHPGWVVFVHFLNENGETRMQGDHPLSPHGRDPWGFVAYRFDLPIAECDRGKDYRVRLGVWSPADRRRLPITRSRGLCVDAKESAVSLGVVRMVG